MILGVKVTLLLDVYKRQGCYHAGSGISFRRADRYTCFQVARHVQPLGTFRGKDVYKRQAYQKVWNAAKAELALRAILKAKGAKGFTTNFDDLGQTDGSYFDQIPGLASQRLMAEGYGFG